MKLGKFFFGATAALMLASCSSDEPTITDVTEPATGDGYIAVAINLPNQPSNSRAGENQDQTGNVNYDDGTDNEYAVNSALLILFTGASESVATQLNAYDLGTLSGVNDADFDNITSSYLKAVQVSDIPEGNLYGLVMLNYSSVGSLSSSKFVLTGESTPVSTLADLTGAITENAFYTGKGLSATNFFMTNSPLSSVIGGATGTAPAMANVTTLVNLTNSIKKTEQEAKDAPAGSFYVERAVAKVTLANNAVSFTAGTKTLEVSNTVWALANMEPTSYVVRNLGDGTYFGYLNQNNYRFVGNTNLGTTSIQPAANPALYRTYWCVDPVYDADHTYTTGYKTLENLSDDDLVAPTATKDGATVAVPLYCHENTFDVDHQNYKNTTTAILKITFKGGDFWTLNGDDQTLYDSESAATASAKVYVCNSMIIRDALKPVMKPNANMNYTGEALDAILHITWTRDAKGYLEIASITIDQTDEMTAPLTVSDDDIEALNGEIKPSYRIAKYEGGVSYYSVRIKHFGDNLTPWTKPGTTTLDTEDAYGTGETAAQKYLGRYGMVRNNWYELNVTGINKLGTPVIPDLNVENPDDEDVNEQWLAFKINVLSWARRTQNIEL